MMTNVMGANGSEAHGELVLRCYRALDQELGMRIPGRRHVRVFRALAALEVRSARRRYEGDVAELPHNHSWESPS
jgi:hypothetical protein